MPSVGKSKKTSFWRKCCRKFTDASHENRHKDTRHHSIRRWKNVQKPHNIVEPIALGYWSTFSSKSKSKTVMPFLGGKHSISGAATTPLSGCTHHGRSSLSPQSYTTAESNLSGLRTTLDPCEDGTLRHNAKSKGFQMHSIDDELEPSFYLGIANGSSTASISSADTSENSRSFESLVNSFDWYATKVFKKLETSVLSLINRTDRNIGKSSATMDSSPSPTFNEVSSSSALMPCTGAATSKDYEIDEAIYGHHAKCFI